MSMYHILKKEQGGRYADVYVHLPIPGTPNVAGVAMSEPILTYQRAIRELVSAREDPRVTRIPGLATQFPNEYADLLAGVVYEYYIRFRFNSIDLTDGQRRSQIENGNENERGVMQMMADIALASSDLYTEIIEPLAWWGYHRDV